MTPLVIYRQFKDLRATEDTASSSDVPEPPAKTRTPARGDVVVTINRRRKGRNAQKKF